MRQSIITKIMIILFCSAFTKTWGGNVIDRLKITIDQNKQISVDPIDTMMISPSQKLMSIQSNRMKEDMAFPELKYQSFFSDSIIIGSNIYFENDSLQGTIEDDAFLYYPDLYLYTGSGSSNSYSFNTSTHVLSVSSSIINGGGAYAPLFRVGWYLSADLVLGSTDLRVVTAIQSAGLNVGYYATLHGSSDLDNFTNLPAGTYYIFIVIDDLNTVLETNENNNINYFTASFTYVKAGKPDLYVYTGNNSNNQFTYNPSTHALSVTNSISNNGTSGANNFRVGWYLSKYTSMGIQDYFIVSSSVTSAIEPGYFRNISATANLDNIQNLPTGNYYLWVYADDLFQLNESNESNNGNYFNTPQIYYGGQGQPNLSIYQGTGSVNGYRYDEYSQILDVVISVGNFGNREAGIFRVGWYMSTDLTLNNTDLLVTTKSSTASLSPGYFTLIQSQADLDNFNGLAQGNYYLFVYIDDTGAITETNETDNAAYFNQIIRYQQVSTEPDINIMNSVLNLNPPEENQQQTKREIAENSRLEVLEKQLSSEYQTEELLLQFDRNVSPSGISLFFKKHGLQMIKAYRIVPNAYLVKIIDGQSTAEKAKKLIQCPEIKTVEPNLKIHIQSTTPNDPGFTGLFGMHNTGQTGGTYDADIDAPEAWDLTTGSRDVIVGVLDTGLDWDHPDLAANMWVNSGEIPDNNIDDDNNGYIDDINGWDFAYDDNDPSDTNGHGTHVAGTVGAVGNNGIGVSGVSWKVSLMALKFFKDKDDGGGGSMADAITGIEYAVDNGADIIQSSTGSYTYIGTYKTAIQNSNLLCVFSAGNDSKDTDSEAHYPSGYDCENIISVASLDQDDYLSVFSNYGANSIDVAAYGTDILSTKPNNPTDIPFGYPYQGLSSDYYGIISGTSMATPQVSGAAALILSYKPEYTWMDLKTTILNNVDVIPSMIGKCTSHGKLNVFNALTGAGAGQGEPVFIIQNTGISKLTITEMSSDQTWLTTSGYSDFPFDINGGYIQQVKADVDWNTAGSLPQTGMITIHSNDPDEPITEVMVHINTTSAVNEKALNVHEYHLSSNYPNPFNPETEFQYTIPFRTHILLEVYNVLGEKLETLINEVQTAGLHKIRFNGSAHESGLYLYQFKAGEFVSTGKMMLLK